jgi:hypothetical protein
MQKSEHLRPPETLSSKPTPQKEQEVELTQAQVEKVFTERTRMLSSITGHISKQLSEALNIKIDHERSALLKMIDTDALAVEEHKRRNKILDYTYFKKKTLNMRNL